MPMNSSRREGIARGQLMTVGLALATVLIGAGCRPGPAPNPSPSGGAEAPAASGDRAGEDPCRTANTQAEMTACWSNEAAAAQRRTGESFKRLSEWLSQRQQTDVLKMFVATQVQWEEYRQGFCEAVA